MSNIKSSERIINSARKLFFKYGISRVSVKEICEHADISKMTFYRNFRSKEDIALAIVREVYDEARPKFNEILKRDIPFEEKIKKVLEMKINLISGFSNEFLSDIVVSEVPEIDEFIKQEKQKSVATINDIFIKAQENGEVRSDVPFETIIAILNSMNDVFFQLQQSGKYRNSSEILKDMFKVLYYGILNRK